MVPHETAEGVMTRIDGGLDPRIVVAGCGGAGCNLVSKVYEKELPGIDTVAVNTDAGALERTFADVRILLAQGVAVDGNPVLAQYAAEASRDLLRSATSADIVFVVVGLGGATGTGAGPVLADASREAGAHTVGIAILPFAAESRADVEDGLSRMKSTCDSVIVLDNNCLDQLGEDLSFVQAFAFVDRVVLTIIEGVLEHLATTSWTSVIDEVESVARGIEGIPEAMPVKIATPVVEAASFEPVGFDATGFIGLR